MWIDGYVQCVVQVKMKAEVIEARRKRLFRSLNDCFVGRTITECI